jgi:hypothetical protein
MSKEVSNDICLFAMIILDNIVTSVQRVVLKLQYVQEYKLIGPVVQFSDCCKQCIEVT